MKKFMKHAKSKAAKAGLVIATGLAAASAQAQDLTTKITEASTQTDANLTTLYLAIFGFAVLGFGFWMIISAMKKG
ncbi:hypothetical protein [Pseudoalteromonas sp. MMG024]|uniref:hypothetical protein n=1 Tax=Pseudoalteromonas sp. MMG024 TaxID=2909980 RepID=UPI001F25093A|nr:hypothetical protein [Pseudoalteromonas sp. MMG024]MCF6455515.1 hypothetical protein [Pseudoalteromonas sp. MMG024]